MTLGLVFGMNPRENLAAPNVPRTSVSIMGYILEVPTRQRGEELSRAIEIKLWQL